MPRGRGATLTSDATTVSKSTPSTTFTDAEVRGWREPAVKESRELCLACKGSKHGCPVRVDMATYKVPARPRQGYALGLLPWAARVAARAPGVSNALARGQPLPR